MMIIDIAGSLDVNVTSSV